MKSILKAILEGLKAGSDQIKVIDHQRIMYVPSSIEIYSNGHETVFTRGGEVIGTDDDLDSKEMELIWGIRGFINPQEGIIARREKMKAAFTDKEPAMVTNLEAEAMSYSDNGEEDSFEL